MAVTINGSTGVQLDDNDKQKFGTGDDLEIYHGSDNNSYIKEGGSGNLYIFSENLRIENADGSESYIEANANGAVELYYNGTKKFETRSGGLGVFGHYEAGDDNKVMLGDSNDLQIYHNGTQNIIGDTTTQLRLISDEIRLRSKTGSETYLEGDVNGAVKIYHDNAQVFYTESYGAVVKRPSGGPTVFEVIGSENQEAIINMFADDGDDNDDKFRLRSGTDNFYIENYSDGAWEKNIEFEGGDGVKFYQNDSLRAQIIGAGIQIEGGNALYLNAGNWSGEANGKIQAHSSHLYFQNPNNSGNWIFRLPNGTEPANINSSGTYSGSDERRKKDITTITNAVSTVKQLTGRSFTWKETDEKSFGVIAQEIEPVLPDLVTTQSVPEGTTDTDPYKMVNYAALTGHFIEAIKELSAEVEALKTKVAALEAHTHE